MSTFEVNYFSLSNKSARYLEGKNNVAEWEYLVNIFWKNIIKHVYRTKVLVCQLFNVSSRFSFEWNIYDNSSTRLVSFDPHV